MTLTLISLLVGLFPTVLKGIPGISAEIQQIISDVTASTVALLGSGVFTKPSVDSVLEAWQGVITALKNDPTLPADSLTAIAQLEKIIQVVITEDAQLAQSVDWSKLNPITPVA